MDTNIPLKFDEESVSYKLLVAKNNAALHVIIETLAELKADMSQKKKSDILQELKVKEQHEFIKTMDLLNLNQG